MKNLKNTVAAIGLMAVLGMGATTAQAGLIISDKPAPVEGAQCRETKDSWSSKIKGVILTGLNGILISDGLIMSDGLIISDSPCLDNAPAKDGLVISD